MPLEWQRQHLRPKAHPAERLEVLESPGFPGLRTVYQVYERYFEVCDIAEDDPVARRIDLPEGSRFTSHEPVLCGSSRKHYWSWVPVDDPIPSSDEESTVCGSGGNPWAG